MKIKKLIPWITTSMLLFTQMIYAQHGTTMSDPIIMEGEPAALDGQHPVGGETWYRWQSAANNTYVWAYLKKQAGSKKIADATVYVYNASNELTYTETDTTRKDSVLSFQLNDLPAGNRIYIQLRGVSQSCSCDLSGTVFKLQGVSSSGCNWVNNECNYVKDGDFEYYSSCPTGPNSPLYGPYKGCYWYSPTDYCPQWGIQLGTADYYNTCSPNPGNFGSTFPPPYSGSGYSGLYVYGQGYNNGYGPQYYDAREYLTNALTQPLTNGNTYTVSMWVRRSAQCQYAIKDLEARLGNGIPAQCGLIQSTFGQSIVFNNTGVISSSTSWVQLTATITVSGAPAGGYTHLTIGNFKSDANTTVSSLFPGATQWGSYYYIDKVSVTTSSSPTITLTASANSVCTNEQVTVSASGPFTSYSWTINGSPTGLTGGSITISNINSTTTFTATGTNNIGCSVSQSIVITLLNCCTNPKSGAIRLKNATLVAYGTPGATPWSVMNWANIYTGNIAIPSSGIISGNYTVRGTFTINTPVTFNNSDIVFDEGLYVTQNQPITINHSWWHACDKMWGGISSRNYISVFNSIIEDANNAVGVVWFGNHPGINIDNTVFNKNNYGVGMAIASINTASPSNFRITGTIFTCKDLPASTYTFPLNGNFISMLVDPSGYIYGNQSVMKGSTMLGVAATRSQAGILTAGVAATVGTYLNIGNTGSTNPPNSVTNYFDYLSAGIMNQSAKLQIVNGIFQEHYQDGLSQYYGGIYHNDNNANNTETRVGATGSSLKKCIFRNGHVGVTARKGGQLNINSNEFNNLAYNSVEFMQWYSPLSGTNPVGAVNVTYNNFNYCGIDVWAYDNSSVNATVENNNAIGIFFNKRPCHIFAQEISTPNNAIYKINNNTMSGKATGIYTRGVNNATVTGNNIDLGYNYFSTFYSGGIWNENSTNCLFGNNTISSSVMSNSQRWNVFGFFTSMSTGNTYCSNNITGVGSCMKFQGYCVPSNVFSNSLNNNPSDPALIGLFLDANGNTGSIGVASGPNWYASENIWGNFNAYDSYCQNSSNTVVGKIYYYVGGSYGPAYFPPSNFMANGSIVMNPVYTSVISGGPLCPTANARMQYTDENTDYSAFLFPDDVDNANNYISCKESYELANNCSDFASAMPDGFMEHCESNNIGKFYTASQHVAEYTTTRDASVLDNARELNNGISPVNVVEATQKRFNTIYYVYLAGDTTTVLDSLEGLRYIARKCPYEYGNGVYQARTLLSAFDPETYANDCEYNPVNTERKDSFTPEGVATAAGIQLYPNPASEKVTVLCGADKALVMIYDVAGAKVAQYNVNKGENTLDVSQLGAGSYLFKVLVDLKPVKMEKILIAR